ncbi:hypothetical protein BDZ90DRAFT_222550, partial [Jaminaea rosea]
LPSRSQNPPPKGFFNPAPTKATTAVDAGADGARGNASSVGRPRRESIGQMRRKASDSATAAASAGGIGLAFANNNNGSRGQPIPVGRSAIRGFSTSPRSGPTSDAPFSTSLGSAAEAISLPASVLNSGAKSGRSTGHTHFGQECFGPEPDEPAIPNPPAHLTKNGSLPSSAPDGSSGSLPNSSALLAAAAAARRGSIAESSNAGDDDASSVSGGNGGGSGRNGKELPIHRCESCNKVYRHPSCLVKHRWEHTVYWKEASKFLMSKHQQVQLLEAAAILVNMDGDSTSLPDEKALWPAAVSPATSGLLGSDKVNFDKMMQRKVARRGRSSSSATSDYDAASTVGGARPSSLSRSSSAGMSPLNSFSKLGLSGGTPGSHSARPALGTSYSNSFTPYSYGSLGGTHRLNSDIQHLVLDESDERTTTTSTDNSDDRTDSRDRSGSAETTEDDDEDDSPGGEGAKEKKMWGLHEDAVAEMDMEE